MAEKEQKTRAYQYKNKEIPARVQAYIQEHRMFERGETAITGISGGADSVCLFFILHYLQEELGVKLVAVHVNHGIRGEDADADERFVQNICETAGIPLEIVRCNLELIAKKRKQSMEEAGRNIRREAFERAAQKYGAAKIALAHHKNDNAETLLMNLVRGTGLNGMTGIKPVRDRYVRPLLCLERREIEGFLEQNGIRYQTDQTNLTEVFKENCVSRKGEKLLIRTEPFQSGDKILREMTVLSCMEEVAGQAKDLSAVHVADVSTLFGKQCGRQIMLPYHMRAVRGYEGVTLEKVHAAREKEKEVRQKKEKGILLREEELPLEVKCRIPGTVFYQTPKGKKTAVTCRIVDLAENPGNMQKSHTNCFDYDIIKHDLCVRTRRPGDYIVIDREGRKQKLKSYLINEKIPASERGEILLIADGSHILWVVGHRLSLCGRPDEHTKRILQIQIDGGESHGRDN